MRRIVRKIVVDFYFGLNSSQIRYSFPLFLSDDSLTLQAFKRRISNGFRSIDGFTEMQYFIDGYELLDSIKLSSIKSNEIIVAKRPVVSSEDG